MSETVGSSRVFQFIGGPLDGHSKALHEGNSMIIERHTGYNSDGSLKLERGLYEADGRFMIWKGWRR